MIQLTNDAIKTDRAGSDLNKNRKSLIDHPAYVKEGMTRISVPYDKISWDIAWPEYDSIEQARYTHSAVLNEFQRNGERGWAADPDAVMTLGNIKSYEQNLSVDSSGEVLNPWGRTGIKKGRGLLGQPGPNIAADPVIFRIDAAKNELQLLLIKRKDTGEWAIPGGMVDFGERATQTLQRELEEETGVKLAMGDAYIVYQGYVDDPRNTDTAWMETTVATKLLEPEISERIKVQAGDDAKAVKWVRFEPSLYSNLYASHGEFVRRAINELVIHEGEKLQGVAGQTRSI